MNQFTIKDLENLSGIKAHTIRIWEQRYNFIKPNRTKTNIRYYTSEELKTILNVSLLNKYGFKVSHINKMSELELGQKILSLNQSEAQQERLLNELVQSMIELKMQAACEIQPSTMAAVLALSDEKVEEVCTQVQNETGEIVVPANYNCPGQLVISGSVKGIEIACEQMKAAGAKRALVLPVGGAFHSPLMNPAKIELAAAIEATHFNQPICPVYQNVTATAVSDPAQIKQNLIAQLTGAVRWTQTVQAMVADGATHFTEYGPGKVLQGLVQKVHKEAVVTGVN